MSGSTNNKVRANNKQIERQHTYDRKFFDYNWQTSLDNFDKAKQLTRLNIANDKAATDYKNETSRDNYRYQVDLQRGQYKDEVNAYNRSVSDYRQQRGLNRQGAKVALESERRVRDEQLISNMFGKREDSLQFRESQSEARYQKALQNNALNTAKTDKKLNKNRVNIEQKGQNQVYRQEQGKFRTTDKLLDQKIKTADQVNKIENRSLGRDIDSNRERKSQLREDKKQLGISRKNLGLDKSNNNTDVKGLEAKQELIERQRTRQTNINTERSGIRDEQKATADEAISLIEKKESALTDTNTYDKDIAEARQNILTSEGNKIRAKQTKLTEDETADAAIYEAEKGINQAEIDKHTAESQAQDDLDSEDSKIYDEEQRQFDEQSEQIGEQSKFGLGDISRKYQRAKTENLGQRMEQYAEQLRAKGAIAAQGRRGQSVDAQQQSALAGYGRQQAQMVDSMVFASQDKASETGSLTSKTSFEQGQILREKTKNTAKRAKQTVDKNLKKTLLAYNSSIKEHQKNITTANRDKQKTEKAYQDALASESLTANEKQSLIQTKEREKQKIDEGIRKSTLAFEKASKQNEKDILDKEQSISDKQTADTRDQLQQQKDDAGRDVTKLGRANTKLTNQQLSIDSQKRQKTAQGRIINNETRKIRDQRALNRVNTKAQKQQLRADKRNNARNKNINTFQKGTQDKLNRNQKSKLEAALDATKSEVSLAKQNINNQMGFNREENRLNNDKFRANNKSANKAFAAAKNKVRLDQYGADLQAKANVMQKPSRPPALPAPRSIPRTRFLEPMRPQKPPKPIKGALGKTSVWNDVGDVFNTGLKIAGLF